MINTKIKDKGIPGRLFYVEDKRVFLGYLTYLRVPIQWWKN